VAKTGTIIETTGRKPDFVRLDIFQNIKKIVWKITRGILVVDMRYRHQGNEVMEYPILPLSYNWVSANENWLEANNWEIDVHGLPHPYQPQIFFGSSGSGITQNSYHRWTDVPTGGGKEFEEFLDKHYMWNQARLDFIKDSGAPTDLYSGNATLYFNLRRCFTQIKPNAQGVKTFKLTVTNFVSPTGGGVMGPTRAATYKKRDTFPLDGTPASNDDLIPMWDFSPTSGDYESFTTTRSIENNPNYVIEVESKALKITTTPPFDQSWNAADWI